MNEDSQGKRLACAMEGFDLQKKPILVVGRSRAVVVWEICSLSLRRTVVAVGVVGGGASEWKGE